MTPRRLVITVVFMWLLAVPVWAEEPARNVAELLPADTLGFVELRQPGALLKEVANLFEGTAFGNIPDSLTKLWGKDGPPPRERAAMAPVGAFGLFLSPEMVKEVGRLQGAGFAVTSFKNGQPQMVAIVLPGESNAPAFFMRAFLTFEPNKLIGEVEGVRIYQQEPRRWQIEPKRGFEEKRGFEPREKPAPPQDRDEEKRPLRAEKKHGDEPAFAMMPGALLIGTLDAVKDVILRAKGKVKGETLAGNKTYQEASKEIGGQPGLFAYVNVPAALVAIENGVQALGKDELAAIKDLIGAKAFRAAGYSVSLDQGTFRYRELALLDPKEKSPVLEAFPKEPVKKELLHFTPADTVLAVAMSNSNGAERWAQIVKLIDACAKIGGAKDVPSEEIAKFEKGLGIDIGKDIMGNITAFGGALGDPMKAPIKRVEEKQGGFQRVSVFPEIPGVVVLQARDEDAATNFMEKVLPKIYGAIHNKANVKPDSKKVDGQTIYSLPIHEGVALNYGRSGKTIVLGGFPKPVSQALNNGAKEKGFLADAKVESRSKELEGTVFVMAMKPATMIAGAMIPWMMEERRSKAVPPRGEEKRDPREKEKPAPSGEEKRPAPARAVAQDRAEARDEEHFKLPKELTQLFAKEELFIIRVTRKDDRILEEGTWPGLKTLVGPLMHLFMEERAKARPADAPPRIEERPIPREERKPSPPDRRN
jgi:hypothetical protein